LAIKIQLGWVAPVLSGAYRFALASLILFAYCRIRGLRLRFSARQHAWIALQGVFLYCINYIPNYYAAQFITTGLMAVIFSTVVGVNIVNSAIFLRTPIERRVVVGALLGFAGIVLVFWSEFGAVEQTTNIIKGFSAVFLATVFASFGNVLSARNQKWKLPITQTNAFGMGYAAILTFVIGMASGFPIRFDASSQYIASLLYLAIFGSVIAFGAYLTLLGRIGPARASYIAVLFPIVALAISTFYEKYHWTPLAGFGVVLITLGNVFVLKRAAKAAVK
jgi:drug/metabolite transporter (DMT)-like permease